MPSMAAVRQHVAMRMQSVIMILGTRMVWCLYLNMLMIHLPPVSRMMIFDASIMLEGWADVPHIQCVKTP